MKKTEYEIASETEAFRRWMALIEEPHISQQSRAKRLMAKALREEVTETQRLYMAAYFGGMKIPAIAAMYGVDKSTVSRGISRGKRRLRRVLKYCGPDLLESTLCEKEKNHVKTEH